MKARIIEIVADYKGVDTAEIAETATFTEIGLDSLDIAELVMTMEDEFGVSIEMSPELNTVEKLAAYIEANK